MAFGRFCKRALTALVSAATPPENKALRAGRGRRRVYKCGVADLL